MSRRFAFDARATMAALAARRAGSAAAVPAVLAVLNPIRPPKPPKPPPPGAELTLTWPREFLDSEPIDAAEVEERAALAADSVPACYLDAWARLQCQRPLSVAESDWLRAIDDAGRFLDAWGADAATMQWGADELFDMPREGKPGGLIWLLAGERVTTLGEDRARIADGRVVGRRRNGIK